MYAIGSEEFRLNAFSDSETEFEEEEVSDDEPVHPNVFSSDDDDGDGQNNNANLAQMVYNEMI